MRDILTAAFFGTGLALDAFLTAFAIPNFFRRLFGEGALSSAFIPTFSDELERKGTASARQLVRQLGSGLALTLAAIVLVGEGIFVLVLLYGHLGDKLALVLKLLLILFPYLFFICLTAFAAAVLNSFKHFAWPALAPMLLNLFWIAGVIRVGTTSRWDSKTQVLVLAGVLTLAGVFQLVMQLPVVARKGMLVRPGLEFDHPGVKRVAGLMAPVMFGLAVVQLNVLVDRLIAYFLIPGTGGPSALYFGNRVMQFPLALIGIAIATAVFPSFAQAASRGDKQALKRLLRQAVRVTLFLAIPAGYGLMALSGPIVALLFQRRSFIEWAALRTSSVVFFYALGLWAYCLQHVLVRAFYSLKDVATPVKVASIMVGLNLALNLTLVWPLQESGLALSTAITAMAQLGVLFYILRRKLGEMGFAKITGSLIKTLAAASLMAAICFWLARVIGTPAGGTFSRGAAAALLPIAVGGGVFLGLARLFGMRELDELLGRTGQAEELKA